jgi:enoyl-CoA hydratase
MSDGEVHYQRAGAVVTIVFDRPEARNAMTWHMYEQLGEACARIAADRTVRVVVFRGAGGNAFIAGTDIAQFLDFKTGDDGVAYEAEFERYITAVEELPVPTLAVVEGWAIGGGLAIASACDFRIATPGSRFGVPIARTLGNCLSTTNCARLVAAVGVSRAKRMLMLAETLGAGEALAAGFLLDIIEPSALNARIAELCERIVSHAPVTLRVTKEAMLRLMRAGVPDGEDLVRACYGSDDFKIGVRAFVDKRKAEWTGR